MGEVLVFVGVLGFWGDTHGYAGVGNPGLRTVDEPFVLCFVQCVLLGLVLDR